MAIPQRKTELTTAETSPARVLIVEDDPDVAFIQQLLLEGEGGYKVTIADSAEEALSTVAEERPDLVISDLGLPGMSGLEFIRRLRAILPETPVMVITASATVENAVAAMKSGAAHYLIKPVDGDDLLIKVRQTLAQHDLDVRHRQLAARAGEPHLFDKLVGSSRVMRELRTTVEKLSRVDSSVLIHGETGTGKELVARLMHDLGPRHSRPFVVVNCAAIPGELLESELFGHTRGSFTGAVASKTGLIEQANSGTLLLDEIGDMPLSLQPKLLRFLQEKTIQRVGGSGEMRVDVRVLAATHCNLKTGIIEGTFREDLYHRLNTIPLDVPPLRDRLEDVPELTSHLMAKICRRLGRRPFRLSQALREDLASQDYPGNVRELENLIERAVVLGDHLAQTDHHLGTVTDEPVEGTGLTAFDGPLEGAFQRLQDEYSRAEELIIRRALAVWCDESNSVIAERLGTQRRVLEHRMRKYDIAKPGSAD